MATVERCGCDPPRDHPFRAGSKQETQGSLRVDPQSTAPAIPALPPLPGRRDARSRIRFRLPYSSSRSYKTSQPPGKRHFPRGQCHSGPTEPVNGPDLVRARQVLGYERVRRDGSHIRLPHPAHDDRERRPPRDGSKSSPAESWNPAWRRVEGDCSAPPSDDRRAPRKAEPPLAGPEDVRRSRSLAGLVTRSLCALNTTKHRAQDWTSSLWNRSATRRVNLARPASGRRTSKRPQWVPG